MAPQNAFVLNHLVTRTRLTYPLASGGPKAVDDQDKRDALNELDDLLDDKRAELEARFRELEQEAELEQLRRQTGRSAEGPGHKDDPLAEMKAALDGDGELERYLLVICPHCQAKNRTSLSRVRSLTPICGRCKEELAVSPILPVDEG